MKTQFPFIIEMLKTSILPKIIINVKKKNRREKKKLNSSRIWFLQISHLIRKIKFQFYSFIEFLSFRRKEIANVLIFTIQKMKLSPKKINGNKLAVSLKKDKQENEYMCEFV